MKIRSLFLTVIFCGSLLAIDPPPEAQAAKSRRATASASKAAPPTKEAVPEPSTGRVVSYSSRDVVVVKAKLRYTTLIILPKNERILDFTCGDKDFWIINGDQNFAYIKPAKEASRTNLNLVTASGNVYSFVLYEISDMPSEAPDLKIFVELKDEGMLAAEKSKPKFVPAQDLDAFKDQLQKAIQEVRQVKEEEQADINKGINRYVSSLKYVYRFTANQKPFFVRAIYHDNRFTYIQARPEETPTIYELREGEPNLVGYEYKDGVYTVYKILDQGYLQMGRQKLGFKREE